MGSFQVPPGMPAPPSLAGPSAPAPFQGYNNPNGPTSPYPPSTGANLLQGIGSFVEQFQKQTEKEREHNANLATQSIQNMMLGLPVDMKKTAAYMKKAGMNIDFETPRATTPPTQAGPPDANGVPAAPSGVGGVAPPGPPNPTMPPSVWDKIKQAMGVTPPTVNPNSVGMQSLQQITDMGKAKLGQQQTQIGLDTGKQAIEAKTQGLITAGLQGNDAAWEALRNVEGKTTPMDQIFSVGRKAGMPENQVAVAVLNKELGVGPNLEKQMELAKTYSPYFGNDLAKSMKYVTDVLQTGKSDLVPSDMSVEDRIKVAQVTNDTVRQYPTAPINLARTYALATAAGNKAYANQLGGILEKFPKEAEIKQSNWTADFKLNQQKFSEQMSEFRQSHELEVMNALRGAMGTQFDQAIKILDSKDATMQEKNAARQMISDASSKLGTIKINGVDISPHISTERVDGWMSSIMHPFSDSTQLGLTVGNPADVNSALHTAITPPSWITDPKERAAWSEAAQKKAHELLQNRTPMPADQGPTRPDPTNSAIAGAPLY